jgi:hypothetical protein
MVPLPRFHNLVNRQFVVGEQYTLIVHEERSHASHSHYFAAVSEAWRNLPDQLQMRWPSSEHLRRWALCRAGYASERNIIARNHKEAMEIGAIVRGIDDYAIIKVSGDVVTVWTARSQSRKAMNKKEFKKSKDAVLRIVSELIGVDATTLNQNAGRAA